MNLTGLVQSTTDSGISIDQIDKSAEEFAKTNRMVVGDIFEDGWIIFGVFSNSNTFFRPQLFH